MTTQITITVSYMLLAAPESTPKLFQRLPMP